MIFATLCQWQCALRYLRCSNGFSTNRRFQTLHIIYFQSYVILLGKAFMRDSWCLCKPYRIEQSGILLEWFERHLIDEDDVHTHTHPMLIAKCRCFWTKTLRRETYNSCHQTLWLAEFQYLLKNSIECQNAISFAGIDVYILCGLYFIRFKLLYWKMWLNRVPWTRRKQPAIHSCGCSKIQIVYAAVNLMSLIWIFLLAFS